MNQEFGILFLSLVGLSLVGLCMLFAGWRGRRLDDHLVCRKCRYDLSGREAESSPTCPECGADLSLRRATRIGNRQRRTKILILGVLLTLIGFGGGGTILGFQARHFNWNTIKPVWWLRQEAKSPVLSEADEAWKELERRLLNDKIGTGQFDGLLELVMIRQADANLPWPPFAGGFMEQGRLKELVTDEMFYESLQVGATSSYVLSTKKKLRPGVSLPIKLDYKASRYSANTWMTLTNQQTGKFYSSSMEITHGGQSAERDSFIRNISGERLGSSGWGSSLRALGRTPMELGEHSYTVGVEWMLYYTTEDKAYGFDSENSEPLLVWQKEYTLAYEVVAADVTIVTMTEDPSQYHAIRNATEIKVLQYSSGNASDGLGFRPVTLQITIRKTPVNVAFEVFAGDGEDKLLLGTISALVNDLGSSMFTPWDLDYFTDRETIDILLRSSIEVAEDKIGFDDIWGGEILLKDVPIRSRAQGVNEPYGSDLFMIPDLSLPLIPPPEPWREQDDDGEDLQSSQQHQYTHHRLAGGAEPAVVLQCSDLGQARADHQDR